LDDLQSVFFNRIEQFEWAREYGGEYCTNWHEKIAWVFITWRDRGRSGTFLARDITQRLQTEFARDAYAFQTVPFWIGGVRCDRQDLSNDNHMGRFHLDDLDVKILAIEGWQKVLSSEPSSPVVKTQMIF
jgi:hypothetical protein